jgi:hypothetical protein
MASDLIAAPNLLQLLRDWTGSTLGPVVLDNNAHGIRGVMATATLHPGDTVLLLPWKYVLGVRAAAHVLESEDSKGRGIDHADSLLERLALLLQHLHDNNNNNSNSSDDTVTTQRWSCWMACALLAAARYPLSPWGSYMASLPCRHQRMGDALQRCHAWTVRQQLKLQAKARHRHEASLLASSSTSTSRKSKLSPLELTQLRRARDSILPRELDFEHVLLWDPDQLHRTGDPTLIALVQQDWAWLRATWEQLFATSDDHTVAPMVSWESWLWAHAIVWSRAVGLESAPVSAQTFGDLRAEGAMLPIFDLINHASGRANSVIEIRADHGVAVVAKDVIPANAEVLFDYHPNATLRFFLRGYGFVNHHGPFHQVFRVDLTRMQIKIAVSACGEGTMMRLARVEHYGMTFTLTDEPPPPPPAHAQQDVWLDPSLQVAAATCCRLVLHTILESVPDRTNRTVADQYRECNIALLERCIGDLESLANLYHLDD